MRENWRFMPLSEVVDRVTTKNSSAIEKVFTVSAQMGLIDQETYFNKQVASKNLSNYWVVEPGDYVFNKSYSEGFPLGVVARNIENQPGVVSPLYIVMRKTSSLLANGWLDLAFSSDEYHVSLQGLLKEGGRAHGALNVKLGDYFSAKIPVPPLPVQRRIVDLMTHLDVHIANLQAERDAFSALLATLRNGVCTMPNVQPRQLEELVELIIDNRGKTPKKLGTAFTSTGSPVLSAINVKEGVIAPSAEPRFVDDATYEKWMKTPTEAGDVLLTSEAPLGQVAQVPDGQRWVLGQRLFALRGASGLLLNDYLTHFLSSDFGQAALVERSSGSTVKGIRQSELVKVMVPWIPIEDQATVAVVLNSAVTNLRDLEVEITRVHLLRTSVISTLISGVVLIPETYDSLLLGQVA